MASFSFFRRTLVAIVACCGGSIAFADPGELVIRDVLPFTAPERAALAALVSSDPEAHALLAEKQAALDAFSDRTPRPLTEIIYEGRLNNDPARITTVAHLYDLEATAAWLEVWQATADPALALRIRDMVSAWTAAYVPTGNDVNEGKLVPLLVAYVALRPEFAPPDRTRIDDWVRRLAAPHLAAARDHTRATGNRYAKRLRLLALAALVLDEPAWRAEADSGLRALVDRALNPDGTSHDLIERDTLTYHTTTLRPLLSLAWLARRREEDLYTWTAPRGGSIKRSVDYVVPYATGEKAREEWKNSRAEIDRQRAAAGIAHYQPGKRYDPRQALPLLEEAELFDPTLGPLVATLSDRPGRRFPTWRTVLNAALRTSVSSF